MSYERFLRRNLVARGDYGESMIAGDLRRMERDQLSDQHIADWASATGIEPEQLRAFLRLFFTTDCVRFHNSLVGGVSAER